MRPVLHADPMAQLVDPPPDRVAHLFRHVGAARVQPLVRRQELRPVTRQVVEEVLARPWTQIEDVRPQARRAGIPRRAHDVREELGGIRQAGQDRCHAHARLDPGVDELAQRAQALVRRRRPRLGEAMDGRVQRRDAERDRHLHPTRGVRQHVEVAHDHRPAGDEAERCRPVRQRRDRSTGQPEPALGRLVRIGGAADGDGLVPPGRTSKLAASTSTTFGLTRIDVP